MMEQRHDYFTADEGADLDRVTKRWSAAGQAREYLFRGGATPGDKVKAVYEEERDAAVEYHATVRSILVACDERSWSHTGR